MEEETFVLNESTKMITTEIKRKDWD